MPRKSNPIKAFRRDLYRLARLIGDVTALMDGTFHKRIVRRLAGRATSRGLLSLYRKIK